MSTRTFLSVLLALLVLSHLGIASATTFYVDASVTASGDGTSWETAFKTIQQGIDAASYPDKVVVAAGVYRENIQFSSRIIVLCSTDPLDSAVVTSTVIDGRQASSTVAFSGYESEECVLSGFTIRNGKADYGGGINGGTGDRCSRATIRNNIIKDNQAEWYGGGLAHCAGAIHNNVIVSNMAHDGIIHGTGGGGLYYCNGIIENNLIAGNSGQYQGGGLYACSGVIQNNTIVANSAGDDGGGLHSCHGTIRNCVIWGNTAGISGEQLHEARTPSHSCIQDWAEGGTGNTSADPLFVNPAVGDYHLGAGSPCLNAGANSYWFVWPLRDLDSDCRLEGDEVDMGCYEHGASLDLDGDLLSDAEELFAGTDPEEEDTDGDGLRDGLELLRGSHPLELTLPGTVNVPSDVPTIQAALIAAVEGDEIVLAPGSYLENLQFPGFDVTLRCSDPNNPDVVASTIIDGGGQWGPVISLSGRETETCLLSGLTIQNGRAYNGAGIRGGTEYAHTEATIRNNTISTNFATDSTGSRGGGIAYCDGLIEGNTFRQNSAHGAGGGLAHCDGTIQNNVIAGNSSQPGEGGGLALCHGTIQNNVIIENSAGRGGGGAWCDGTIRNNTITDNVAGSGGGLCECQGTIKNNVIYRNSADFGGGLLACDGTVVSNTIVENSPGGLLACDGTITNCIIWGNAGGYQLPSDDLPTYCCIEDWTSGGLGNITFFPYFADGANDDYHLKSCSPCIDAGGPASAFSEEPQPNGGRINIGAYGNTPEATSKSPDNDGDGLPDDWEMEVFGNLSQGAEDDPDADGLSNEEEYRWGFQPLTLPLVWYVDASVTASGDGTCWETAFKTIHEAIDAASDRDTVIVGEGIYVENIAFNGKDITLASTDPENPAVVRSTIIDGNGTGPVVEFLGSESDLCTLAGFTIRNGDAGVGGGVYGGAGGAPTHATIRNNVITGNGAGGGGGGLALCDGLIRDNLIVGNVAGVPNTFPGRGGGLFACHGTIENNVIAGNSAREGGGLSRCEGTIRNNTVAGNSAQRTAAGLDYCNGIIQNCIVWGNTGAGPLWDCSTPLYSCVEGWRGGGEGNTAHYPHFVDPVTADFHLESWSPCIDAGDSTSPFSEEPEPNGSRVNMGAYGNTPEATSRCPDADADGLPDAWETEHFGHLAQGPHDDSDEDFISNVEEYHRGSDPRAWAPAWYVDRSVATPGDGTSWERAFKHIQQGIDAAAAGEAVVVARGVYRENIHFDGKNIQVRSTDPLDPQVVGGTVIDGGQLGSVVAFSGSEPATCILGGFTIRNGLAEQAAGIHGGPHEHPTHATIQNNIIELNVALRGGGGMAFCDGIIENNLIRNNSISWEDRQGGGIFNCNGIIQSNVITGNSATYGGGVIYCDGTIRNNIIFDNSAVKNGGGLVDCNGLIENSTIHGNFAGDRGGGMDGCEATIRNCIVWGNSAPHGSQITSSSQPSYSCIEGWGSTENANISYHPYFVDARDRDYHLLTWSPCVDAGDPASPYSEEPDPNGGRANMGAYGNTAEATAKSPDTDQDGLPDEWERKFFGDLAANPEDDPEADGISNIEEYLEGMSPVLVVRHVDASVATSGDGRSWETAFKTIQEGIDVAFHPDVVIVAEGTYEENINFRGKNVTVRSRNPDDAEIISSTIIDGGHAGPTVTFTGAEFSTCALLGFTIRNGQASFGGGIYGSEFWGGHTHATIQNNIIEKNSATYGGGVAHCDGTIQNNLIVCNSADTSGGGLYHCHGTIQNNTISKNSAAQEGGGLTQCRGSIRNCIIWGNTAGIAEAQVDDSRIPAYCCIQDWGGGGAGNISEDPLFVGAAKGDYRLRSGSPCIDAGVNYYWFAWPQRDLYGNCRLVGEGVDMGCYEYGSSRDTDGDLLSDAEEFLLTTDTGLDDSDWDGLRDGLEVLRGSDPLSPTVPQIIFVPSGTPAVQQAVCLAVEGDEIIVEPGTYRENLHLCGPDVILRGSDPEDWETVSSTVLDGRQLGPVVWCTGRESDGCVLAGFTIRNGKASHGGGICGGTWDNPTLATIRNNRIIANSADDTHGGGAALCDGAVRDNFILSNSALVDGGGLWSCDGVVQNNLICGNSAKSSGGGLFACEGTIRNNTIVANSASEGGGVCWCHRTILNCIIWGNAAASRPQVSYSTMPTYSCIQDWIGGGQGNISQNPLFVDPDGGDDNPQTYEDNDYRLSEASPCIDTGLDQGWMRDATDLDGKPRILLGQSSMTVDMGAYEYGSFAFRVVDVANSVDSQTQLTWASRPGDSYAIWSCMDPSLGNWIEETTIPSQGEVTTWTDPAAKCHYKLYRVELK